jgi:hypothetical protein
MDLLDLLKMMFRRWYVSTPIVILTIGAAIALGASIQPEYKTSVAVLLVPPTVSAPAPSANAAPQPGNPWLRVGESAMAQAVEISISAHESRTKISAAGGDPGYDVSVVNRSSILTMAVTAATEASALATARQLTELVKTVVAEQQARYKPRTGEQITTEVLDAGLNVTPSRSNVLRAQIVVGVIGLLIAAALTVLFDAIARRRSTRRQGSRRRPRPPAAWDGDPATVESPAVAVTPATASAGVPAGAGDTRPLVPVPALHPRSGETTGPGNAAQRASAPNGGAFGPKAPSVAAGARSDEPATLATMRAADDSPAG